MIGPLKATYKEGAASCGEATLRTMIVAFNRRLDTT